MKNILILLLLGLFCGCSNYNKNEKIVFDKIVFTKGQFHDFSEENDECPDSLLGVPIYGPNYFASRSIVKIEGNSAILYLNEYGNLNKGYYRASLNDSLLTLANNLFSKVDFNNIIDSTRIEKSGSSTYDGYAYYLFLTKNGVTKKIEFIDVNLKQKKYRNSFSTLVNFIDSLEVKLNLTKMVDSTNTKIEFDSLKETLVNSVKGSTLAPNCKEKINIELSKVLTRALEFNKYDFSVFLKYMNKTNYLKLTNMFHLKYDYLLNKPDPFIIIPYEKIDISCLLSQRKVSKKVANIIRELIDKEIMVIKEN